MKALVIKSTGSWYRVKTDQNEQFDVRLRGKMKLQDKKITNPIAVGDIVILEKTETGEYIIADIEPRKNYVIRISPRKKAQYHMLASNVDQAAVVTSLRHPRTSTGFIDRFFITLETFRIPGVLIINKADLYTKEELELLEHTKELYESLGYKTIITSIAEGRIEEIVEQLKGKKTLLCGHSGTGKSTLINKIIPGAKQDVSEVSTYADKGVHTTTFAEMFDLKEQTHIIDTPGIKELGLADIEDAELSHYFPEMRQFLGQCKFNNCLHLDEPGCVVREAVDNGEISFSRYDSYLSMLASEDNRR